MLSRCLSGIAQLDYGNFEVVVVADLAGCAVVPDGMLAVPFDQPNISAARNLGISNAAGDIIAFIDDDAVPEPTWLKYLVQPFSDPEVAASGGFVIGRNGISFQWKARMAFPDGSAVTMAVSENESTVLQGEPGRAIKTEGTNMAFRARVLRDMNGFDTAFAFFLDETDLNMRLAAMGGRTAITPFALVHHGFAESPRRTAGRVPRDLTAIGKSLRAFVQKHNATLNPLTARQSERDSQRRRLIQHMCAGTLMPGDVGRILHSFDRGWNQEPVEMVQSVEPCERPFMRFTSHFSSAPTVVIAGRFWQKSKLFAEAEARIAEGRRVFVIMLSFTTRFHAVHFDSRGFWVQQGGQFGKSDRSGRLIQFWRAKRRIDAERLRVSTVRNI